MDITPVLTSLGSKAHLPIESTEQLAREVNMKARELSDKNDAYKYRKRPTVVPISNKPLSLTPADVLRELGTATTFLPSSPFADVARHWAQLRYCGTLSSGRTRRLSLSHIAPDLVYHHKVTQSEQLGVGLALVVAKAVLHDMQRGWEFSAVDAEVALKAGFIDGIGKVEQVAHTKKRPDYLLIGHRFTGNSIQTKIVVLECKGTHSDRRYTIEQLATASVQLQTIAIGDLSLPGLMIGSCLSRGGITSFVLDPPGSGDMWAGSFEEMQFLLGASMEEPAWRLERPSPREMEERRLELEDTGVDTALLPIPHDAERARDDVDASAEPSPPLLAPGIPAIYRIPPDGRTWLFRVLARSAAASALLFAGNSSAARDLTTARQRMPRSSPPNAAGQLELANMEDLGGAWQTSTAKSLPLPDGQGLEGTLYTMPVQGGRQLEVFRGVERDLYAELSEGNVASYFQKKKASYRRLSSSLRNERGVTSVGRDGTAVVMRLSS